jgi:hypothetical protein
MPHRCAHLIESIDNRAPPQKILLVDRSPRTPKIVVHSSPGHRPASWGRDRAGLQCSTAFRFPPSLDMLKHLRTLIELNNIPAIRPSTNSQYFLIPIWVHSESMSMRIGMSEGFLPLIPTNPRTKGEETPTAFRYRTRTQSASCISLTHSPYIRLVTKYNVVLVKGATA